MNTDAFYFYCFCIFQSYPNGGPCRLRQAALEYTNIVKAPWHEIKRHPNCQENNHAIYTYFSGRCQKYSHNIANISIVLW